MYHLEHVHEAVVREVVQRPQRDPESAAVVNGAQLDLPPAVLQVR